MSHAHVISMRNPHEALNLPLPIGRRMGEIGRGTWVAFVAILTLVCSGMYIYQVNLAATKSYELRNLEKDRDRLQEMVSALESNMAQLQSMKSMQEKIKGLGYVPIQNPQYVEVNHPTYALAK